MEAKGAGVRARDSPWDRRLQEICGCVLTQASPVAQDHMAALTTVGMAAGSTGEGRRYTNCHSTRVCRPPSSSSRMSHRSPIAPRKASRCSQEVRRGSSSKRTQASRGGKVTFVPLCPSAGYKWRLQEAWRKVRLLGPMRYRGAPSRMGL